MNNLSWSFLPKVCPYLYSKFEILAFACKNNYPLVCKNMFIVLCSLCRQLFGLIVNSKMTFYIIPAWQMKWYLHSKKIHSKKGCMWVHSIFSPYISLSISKDSLFKDVFFSWFCKKIEALKICDFLNWLKLWFPLHFFNFVLSYYNWNFREKIFWAKVLNYCAIMMYW